MPTISSGLLLYRLRSGQPEVLLVHPSGPFFKNKDDGAWSIPKGEAEPGEELLAVARREFREETGQTIDGRFVPLPPVKQKGGKTVHAWAIEGDCDTGAVKSNTFTIEWPPRSGRQAEFPEIDRAAFFDLAAARTKINPGQTPLLDALQSLLSAG